MDENTLKGITTIGGTIATFLFGGFDTLLIALVSFMILDYITGVIRSYMTQKLSSNTGLRGICKKTMMLSLVVVAVLLDRIIGNNEKIFRTAILWFLVANEGLSILENYTACGLPIHHGIKNALEQIQAGNKKAINKKENKEDLKDENRYNRS